MEIEKGRRIHVVGSGRVGFWLAVGLSRANVGHIVIYDDDDLQGGLGHNRLPLATPTTRKVDLLRGFLRVNFGGDLPEFVAARFCGKEADKGDLVVDCSDMPGTRRRTIWNQAKKKGARLLRVSYDGANSTVTIAEGLPIVLNEAASGYANVPSLALSLMAGGMGAEVVARLLANWDVPFVEFNISLADWVPGRVEAAACEGVVMGEERSCECGCTPDQHKSGYCECPYQLGNRCKECPPDDEAARQIAEAFGLPFVVVDGGGEHQMVYPADLHVKNRHLPTDEMHRRQWHALVRCYATMVVQPDDDKGFYMEYSG